MRKHKLDENCRLYWMVNQNQPQYAFSGNCEIHNGCEIGIGSVLDNVILGAFSQIKPYSVLESVVCGKSCILGLSALLGVERVVITVSWGHFKVTRSSIGDRVKISHQNFVGDGKIDNDVVLGSGTVFYQLGRILKKHYHYWSKHFYWLWYDDNCSCNEL